MDEEDYMSMVKQILKKKNLCSDDQQHFFFLEMEADSMGEVTVT